MNEFQPSNQYYLRFLNPFDPIFWISFDLSWECPPDEPLVTPEYTIEHFLSVFSVEFLGFIEEGKTLNGLFNAFMHIAKNYVDYQLIGEDEELYKYLVSMYIGHHMEMAMGRIKNQADEISMTPEKGKDKKIEYKIEYPKYELQSFQQTKYGFAFWTVYKPYLTWRFKGIYTNRGYRS